MRLTTEREDEALYLTALPKFYNKGDWDADLENSNNTSNRTPRFRGAATVGDVSATGTITTNQGSNLTLNNNDFVIYRGG